MLRCSFIILPGVGVKREKRLWQQGIRSWDAFERSHLFAKSRYHDAWMRVLGEARHAYLREDWEWFAERLGRDAWRLLAEEERVVYVDVESYGVLKKRATLIAFHDGRETRILPSLSFPRQDVQWMLNRQRLLVTFHGRAYDLPILEKLGLRVDHLVHIPAESLFARLGWHGSLTSIEERIGITRGEDERLGSGMPLRVWKRWIATGREEYYEQLAAYVRADVEHLAIAVRQALRVFKQEHQLTPC